MFNRRKRSYRKGPPANQIYVPHDQRKLTADPIPIMTEQQAQYYYNQLKDMGYIQEPVDNYKPEVILIKKTGNYLLDFKLDNDQSLINDNINADTCDALDMNGNVLDKTKYDLVNILNQNGYKLYPLLCRQQLNLTNTSNGTRNIWNKFIDTNTSNTVSLDPGQSYYISESYSGEWRTGYPIRQENYLMWVDNDDIYTEATPIMFVGNASNFKMRCLEMICVIVSQ